MTDRPETHHKHVLSLCDVHVHYGQICALRDFSIDLHCGRAVALLGGNGAGKSTLMKAIVGLVPASSGHVHWCGAPVTASTHEIAYLPQRAALHWDFPITVSGLVEMGRYPLLGRWGRFTRQDEKAVAEAVSTMQIEDLANRQIGALSGQQQRVLIARALAQQAHVLLLDEPFAGLDQPAQDLLARLLGELSSGGRLVVASHHDLKTVDDIFDEVVMMNGTLVATGPSAVVMTEANLKRAFGEAE